MENYDNIPQQDAPREFSAEQPAQQNTCPPSPASVVVPAPAKKPSLLWKIAKGAFAAFLVITLVITCCSLTGIALVGYTQNQKLQSYQEILALKEQIAKLEDEIDKNSYTGSGNSVSGTPTPVEGLSPAQVHAQNKDCVVGISNQGITTNIFGQVTETASSGSGFIISENGYIVTNYHVIEGAGTLTVISNDETEYSASVIGYDEGNDFALIKIEATGLPYVTLGSSSDLIVGDQVVAIGNPLGEITTSLTVGYISVKDRDVTIENTIINMLQTDCAINPGNSGGPLFNMKGEVIGITSAKYSGDAVEGIGFAIPIDDVSKMIQELLEKGYISTPYMGVKISTYADGVGAYISSVEAGSPAANAGIKKGDIIVAIGDYATSSLSELDRALRNFEPGETVTVQVYRNRQIVSLTLTFGSKNQQS